MKREWESVQKKSGQNLTPAIIVLAIFDRFPKKEIKFTRENVFRRDDYICQYCCESFEIAELNLDHVVPKSQGGMHTWENVVASCRRCNSKKGGRTPHQAGLHLRRAPRAPREHGWLFVATGSPPDPAWSPYLRREFRNS